ncbi:NACHT domain-containing protein [Acetobacter cibinongensis]|uniref:NACHT domain-containing protein n=1 Tax=Acetobacter cibinongensis TaxID=146475 RepID=A0A1Z5YUD5_9PROT|nr:NACHT domain-containing protein [Acetobacter cibinongensis]OUJ02148.1 hypothetical protein HK14_06800 [Acetobacter cibinongensis]
MDLFTSAAAAGLTKVFFDALKEEEKKAISYLLERMLKPIKNGNDKLSLIFGTDSETYLWSMYEKCSRVKTILNRNSPVKISDCFVSPDFCFKNEKGILSEISLNSFLEELIGGQSKNIITGLAGSGKSILLKYIFNQIVLRGYSGFPIFFEFRNLYKNPNETENILFKAICESIKNKVPNFNENKLRLGLESGSFYLLLDGFDEVPLEKREKIRDEIILLSEKYQQCPIIITSRPSRDFISWSGFREININKFDKQKIIEYIKKIPFDEEKKSDFITQVIEISYDPGQKISFYTQNKDFLSNPLLASMMLLVYDKRNKFPKNKYAFYSKCYDTLSEEHDSLKGSYKRELFSPLNIEEISSIFMYFCVLSYKNSIFSFQKENCLSYIQKSVDMFSKSTTEKLIDRTLVLKDFCESLSILQEDGSHYEFIHRSFQEYFYAKFSVVNSNIKMKRIVDSILFNSEYNNILSLIDSVNHELYEKEFILKIIDYLVEKIETVKNKKDYVAIFFDEIRGYYGVFDLYISEHSHDYRHYFSLECSNSLETRELSRVYVNILMDHIDKYYSNILHKYKEKMYKCMWDISNFNFDITNNGSKYVNFIPEEQLEKSKSYLYCETIYDLIKETRTRIEEINRKIDDSWENEFSLFP